MGTGGGGGLARGELRALRPDVAPLPGHRAYEVRPPLLQAHFWLSRALWRVAGRQEEALENRTMSREAREIRLDRLDVLARIRQEAAYRAKERAEKRGQRKVEIAAGNAKRKEESRLR